MFWRSFISTSLCKHTKWMPQIRLVNIWIKSLTFHFISIYYSLLSFCHRSVAFFQSHIMRSSAFFFKSHYLLFSFGSSSRGWRRLSLNSVTFKNTNSVSRVLRFCSCKERHSSDQHDVEIPLRMEEVGKDYVIQHSWENRPRVWRLFLKIVST